MQVRLNSAMPLPYDTLGRRVAHARKQRGLTQAGLAKASGLKQPDISKIELGLIQKTTGIARLAQALHVPVDWLELGTGPEPTWPPRHAVNEALVEYNAGRPLLSEESTSVAHAVSQSGPIIALQKVTWEGLPVAKLDVPFQMHIPGDELMPVASRGEVGLFMPGKKPRPGRGVLLMDHAGNFYLRLFGEGIGGNWIGYSNQPGIAQLDRDTHGLAVIAPMIGSYLD